jgi:hypothetical protein
VPQAYAQEYVRLSLLGVFNINQLVDCTKALPGGDRRPDTWQAPDQSTVDQWLNSVKNSMQVANELRSGNSITYLSSLINGLLGKILGFKFRA